MKNKCKMIVSVFIVVFLLFISICHLSNLFERKDSNVKFIDFFEQKEDFDVLFFGTSHVADGIIPMTLWNDFGIVSYNVGSTGGRLPTAYWLLENVLEYTTPQLVVIDCFTINSNDMIGSKSSWLHLSFDAFPLSVTKIKAVFDLFGDNLFKKNGETTGFELLFNYSLYHSRWDDLTKTDFDSTTVSTKGATELFDVTNLDISDLEENNNKKMTQEPEGLKYLKKMIETCQERGIQVLLAYMPVLATKYEYIEINTVYDLADEYNLKYVNLLEENIIDYKVDFSDRDHLNTSGATKVTEYLGNYIMENYDIVDRRQDDKYSEWNQDYEEYIAYKSRRLKTSKSLDEYLNILYSLDYDVLIDTSNFEDLDYYSHYLTNLKVDTSVIDDTTDFIVIKGNGKSTEYYSDFCEKNIILETGIGDIKCNSNNNQNEYTVYLKDLDNYKIEQNFDDDNVKVMVIDKEKKKVVDNAIFFKNYNSESKSYLFTK